MDLRQVSIHFVEALNLLLDEFLDDTFGVSVGEINLRIQVFRVLRGASSTECENDARQKVLLLNGKERFFKI